MRWLQKSIIFFLLALPLFAGAKSDEPFKIGISLGLTGKYAPMSAQALHGFKLWQNDINKHGGLLGRPVELVIYDDASDPNVGKNRYEQIITQDKADFVFAPYSSEITDAVAGITEKYGYPLLTSGAAADELWEKGYQYLFGVYITASKYSEGFLGILVKHNFSTVAIISADDLASTNLAAGAQKLINRYGLKIVYSKTFKKGERALDSIVKEAQASKAEALIVCGHLDESVNARLSLKRIGWLPKAYFATVGPTLDDFHRLLQDDADYTFSVSQWEPSSSFPGAKEFTKTYIETYHATPSYHAAAAYAAGQILERAVMKTHSFDRHVLRDALSSLDTITIIGRYGVDRTGKQIRHFAVTIQWQNGQKQIVAPQELMTTQALWR